MDQKDGKPPDRGQKLDGSQVTGRGRKAVPDAAFDLWLERGLHAMFDDVAQEPIPPELLRLIEEDRRK